MYASGNICVKAYIRSMTSQDVTISAKRDARWQPKISRHLAYLRRAGIVRPRRDGKWMHYRIERPDDTAAAAVLDAALASMKTDQQMLGDLQRLATACCGTQGLVWLVGAPVPAHGERRVGLKS
jgi:hypothetical protein